MCRGYFPVTMGGFSFKGDPAHVRFWRLVNQGNWEPETFRVLRHFLTTNSVYCDIGAWIGPTVMYASMISRKVYCFEPDYYAYRYLLHNLQLNNLVNVTPFGVAVGITDGIARMAPFGKSLGDSTSSLMGPRQDVGNNNIDVMSLTFDTIFRCFMPERIDFFKIDVEGGEFSLLPTLTGYLKVQSPIIFLSTHAPYLEPTSRRQSMEALLATLDVYGTCLDENLCPIDRRSLLTPAALESFRSLVFMNKKKWRR